MTKMPDLFSTAHKEDTQCRSSKKSVRFDENTNNKNDNNNNNNNNNFTTTSFNSGNKTDLNETDEDDNDELNINLIDNTNKKLIKLNEDNCLITSNKTMEYKKIQLSNTSNSNAIRTTSTCGGDCGGRDTTPPQPSTLAPPPRGSFMRNFLKFFRHLRHANSLEHLNGECVNNENASLKKHSSSQSSIDSVLSNSSKNYKCCICKSNRAKRKKMIIKNSMNEKVNDDNATHNHEEAKLEPEQTEEKAKNRLESFKIRTRSSFNKFKKENSLDIASKMPIAPAAATTTPENKNSIQINVTDSSPDSTLLNTYINSNTSSSLLSKRTFAKKIFKDGKLTQSSSNNLLSVQTGGSNPGAHNHRRESFLYRAENDLDSYVKLPMRSASIASTSDTHQDELIVTPFAQVLASLKTVRQNFVQISNVPVEKTNKYQIHPLTQSLNENASVNDDATKLIKDTLEEIDWCLMQLERMQSFRTISDPATTKFRQLLNKELTQYGEADQIKAFISQTYLDQKEEIELTNNEGSNRPLGSHRSDSSINLNRNDDTQNDELCNNNSINLSSTNRTIERLKSIDETNTSKVLQNKFNRNLVYNKNIPQKSFEKCETVAEHETPSVKTENPSPSNDSIKAAQSSTSTTRKQLTHTTTITQNDLTSNKHPMDAYKSSDSTMNTIFLTRTQSNVLNETKNEDNPSEMYPYGVKTSRPEELDNIMQDLHVWGLDLFLMDELTEHRPLTAVAYTIFKQRDLMNKFSICPNVLINYLNELEDHYQSVPYHNKIHAADVTQSIHVLLNSKALESVFNDVEIFAAVFSAAIHDVDHPGLTNQYLITTASELALMYNDDSVLENHHLAVAFKLLQHEKRDIFQNIPKKQRQLIRTIVIDMVRATDMSKHMSLLAELKTMVETKKVAGSGIIELDLYQDRIRVLKNMLHCADLSNPTKPLDIYRKWTDRVMNEFFLQGDREFSQGLEISAMCDRHKACIEKTQVGFIDFIVHPLWESWSDLVHPDAQDILDTLERNRDWYCEQVENLQVDNNNNNNSNEKAQTTPSTSSALNH